MKRAAFYAGVFVLCFTTLMLEVIETRMLSVVSWYHLAFFVISAAMFGLTGGAVWVPGGRVEVRLVHGGSPPGDLRRNSSLHDV